MPASTHPFSAPLARLSAPLSTSHSPSRTAPLLPSLPPLDLRSSLRLSRSATPALHSAPCHTSRSSRCSAGEGMATASQSPPEAGSTPRVIKLEAIPLSREAFAPFGEVVEPAEDGVAFGAADAALDLSQGAPRVYIMRLRDRKLGFGSITHHARVTQCLGAVGGQPWFLGVAPPSLVQDREGREGGGADGRAVKQGAAGQSYRPPEVGAVRVFLVEGAVVVKLHAGTWHAGPLFTAPCMDFFNLELHDTNVVDHTTHSFADSNGVVFEFDDTRS
ncbi:unnamed protein product [Closterium sp. NIES-64]|nr:unnamed protein product [Closterium sp. NIES-64]